MTMSNNKTFIIAEAGVNHNGSIKRAIKMIDVCKKIGADAIKFQHFKADLLVKKNAKKAPYQIKNTKNNQTQYKMLKKLELKENQYFVLKNYCKKKNIKFISSAFDEQSIIFLNDKLKEKIIKIPSGEINNFFLLKELNIKKNFILLSTGMSNYKEIADAINLICKGEIFSVNDGRVNILNKKLHRIIKKRIVILHCVTDYPVVDKYANLLCVKNMINDFKLNVGYSDHTLGITAPLAAVVYGAKVIEKHFTLNNFLPGPDHLASLDPVNFRKMIESIREFEKMRGSGIKKIQECEKKNIKIARKSLLAKKIIKKGEKFTLENINCKRPGNGLSPMVAKNLLNKKATKNYNKDDPITLK